MTNDILELLIDWVQKQTHHGKLTVTKGEDCGTTGVRLEMDTSKLIAEIICWRGGNYVAEILYVKSEKPDYRKHGVCSPENFSSEFSEFFGILKTDGI